MRTLHLGAAVVALHENGLTVTHLMDGKEIPAVPQDTEDYRARARELGYGGDTAAMSRDHEIGHSVLACLLGLPESPTLRGVADERFWRHWRAEEAAVLAFQAYARIVGVDMVEIADRLERAARASLVGERA
ncbi:hypothetical protein LB566_03155 [Mesorhizobium sp. CA13]|uniref:hypothetical protein n=1 Tax=Mesorhizobium sp. CA13 TaxID=2876643 RepID=UPI001CCB5128|nr:hypothetical protein [Mesorhizobium sp. CA13]MBZ9852780.1 hypothetical protein [Mesorhizobium sp. CA13]